MVIAARLVHGDGQLASAAPRFVRAALLGRGGVAEGLHAGHGKVGLHILVVGIVLRIGLRNIQRGFTMHAEVCVCLARGSKLYSAFTKGFYNARGADGLVRLARGHGTRGGSSATSSLHVGGWANGPMCEWAGGCGMCLGGHVRHAAPATRTRPGQCPASFGLPQTGSAHVQHDSHTSTMRVRQTTPRWLQQHYHCE